MAVAAILGKKVGMTQVYDQNNRVVPVTVIKAGPCSVLEVRTKERDGYESVQLGFDDSKVKNSPQAMIGHCAKSGSTPKRFIREFRMAGAESHSLGDILNVDVFEGVTYVDVTAMSKGRGFAGVMKRHGMGGQPDSHGTERKHRSPGSIGGYGTDRGHGGDIKKGKRMAGHMGHVRVTVKNQSIFSIMKDDNLILVRGAVPGPNGGYVIVRASKTKK
ncbi:MAG: 50S ribosomal protein L3 [Phycisphaerae bacterium]|jgi:large subunit ribosomal protein L3|nr:50S ribosomal protein L3 [Phycisphaerae bacterium]